MLFGLMTQYLPTKIKTYALSNLQGRRGRAQPLVRAPTGWARDTTVATSLTHHW